MPEKLYLNQPELVVALVEAINEQNGGNLAYDADIFNVCIEAANIVKSRLGSTIVEKIVETEEPA